MRDGDGILGHLQLVPTDAADVLELKSMAVLESRRGHGIGRALVAAAIGAAVSERVGATVKAMNDQEAKLLVEMIGR